MDLELDRRRQAALGRERDALRGAGQVGGREAVQFIVRNRDTAGANVIHLVGPAFEGTGLGQVRRQLDLLAVGKMDFPAFQILERSGQRETIDMAADLDGEHTCRGTAPAGGNGDLRGPDIGGGVAGIGRDAHPNGDRIPGDQFGRYFRITAANPKVVDRGIGRREGQGDQRNLGAAAFRQVREFHRRLGEGDGLDFRGLGNAFLVHLDLAGLGAGSALEGPDADFRRTDLLRLDEKARCAFFYAHDALVFHIRRYVILGGVFRRESHRQGNAVCPVDIHLQGSGNRNGLNLRGR